MRSNHLSHHLPLFYNTMFILHEPVSKSWMALPSLHNSDHEGPHYRSWNDCVNFDTLFWYGLCHNDKIQMLRTCPLQLATPTSGHDLVSIIDDFCSHTIIKEEVGAAFSIIKEIFTVLYRGPIPDSVHRLYGAPCGEY